MKQKLYNINESTLDSLLHRVKVLESVLIEGKRDQEVLNNFLGDDYYSKYNLIKNKIKDPEYKDIYKLIKKDPDEVKDYIDNIQSSRDIRRSDKQGAKLIYSDDTWNVYKITTYDAAKYYGKGTKWCITGRYAGHEERGEEYFYDYVDRFNLDGGYYFYINKKDSEKKYCLLQDVNGRVRSIWDASDNDLGSKNTVEMMLPVVPGVNLKAVTLDELLMAGAQRGDVALVKNALLSGADVEDKNEYGETALWCAADKGYTGVVKLLVDAGADINITDDYENTVLMNAVGNGHVEVVKLLIDAGADANTKNKLGITALMYAAADGLIKIVKLLLDAGADANTKNKIGYTALKIALDNGYDDIAELLIKYGAKSESRRRNRLNRKYLY